MLVCAGVFVVGFAAAGRQAPRRASASAPTTGSAARVTRAAARISLGVFYANSTLTFASLHGRDGATLQISARCGSPSSLDAIYSQTRAGAVLSQDYAGRLSVCSFTRDLDSGRLTLHWGRRFAFTFAATLEGTPRVRSDRAQAHCYATDTTRLYRVTGSLAARIHPLAYGDFLDPPLTLTVDTIIVPQCAMDPGGIGAYEGEFVFAVPHKRGRLKTVGRVTGDELTGFRGDTQLDATQGTGPLGGVDLTADVDDHPARGVSDNLSLRLGATAFSARTSDLQTARIDGVSPFSSGSMTYVSGAGCSSSADATQGILRGAIRIHDPGAVHLVVTGHEVGRTELDGPHVRSKDCRGVIG